VARSPLLGAIYGTERLLYRVPGVELRQSREDLIAGSALLGVALLSGQMLGFVKSFVVAKVLGPERYGLWNGLNLLLNYAPYVCLGVVPALAREIPFARGQGNEEKVASIQDTALTFTAAASLLVALFSFVVLPLLFSDPLAQIGVRMMGVLVLAKSLYNYYLILWRSYSYFSLVSAATVGLRLLEAFLVIPLVILFGFTGQLWGLLLAQCALVVWMASRTQHFARVRLHLNLEVLGGLIRVGTPLLVAIIFWGLLTSIDRLMILSFLGAQKLGYFGIAMMVRNILWLLPLAISNVLLPTVSQKYGEFQEDASSLKQFLIEPTMALAYMVPVMIGTIYLSLPVGVERLLPKYTPGVAAAQIVVVGLFPFMILGMSANFLITINKRYQYAAITASAVLVNVVLNYLFLSRVADYGHVRTDYCSGQNNDEITVSSQAVDDVYFACSEHSSQPKNGRDQECPSTS